MKRANVDGTTDLVRAHCSKEKKMYKNNRNNTLKGAPRRRAFIDNGAAFSITGTGNDSSRAPWLKEVMQSRASSERSVP